MSVINELQQCHACLIGLVSALLLVITAYLLATFITLIPADYFCRRIYNTSLSGKPQTLKVSLFNFVRNFVGGLLVILGLILIPVPAPGVVVLIVGLSIMEFPGKLALELRMIRFPGVAAIVNGFRARKGARAMCLPINKGSLSEFRLLSLERSCPYCTK